MGIDREKWRERVKQLEKEGKNELPDRKKKVREAIAAEKNVDAAGRPDERPEKTLRITHHTLLRYVEYYPNFNSEEVKKKVVSREEAKRIVAIGKNIFRAVMRSRKILLPENLVFGKFLKRGASDDVYYESPDFKVFTITREAGCDVMVTIAKPPRGNRKKNPVRVDDMVDPKGLTYVRGITHLELPFTLEDGLDYEPVVQTGSGFPLTIRWGR